jgi:hypothetical protein
MTPTEARAEAAAKKLLGERQTCGTCAWKGSYIAADRFGECECECETSARYRRRINNQSPACSQWRLP